VISLESVAVLGAGCKASGFKLQKSSKYFSFKDYEKAYRFIEEKKGRTMKVIIDMEK